MHNYKAPPYALPEPTEHRPVATENQHPRPRMPHIPPIQKSRSSSFKHHKLPQNKIRQRARHNHRQIRIRHLPCASRNQNSSQANPTELQQRSTKKESCQSLRCRPTSKQNCIQQIHHCISDHKTRDLNQPIIPLQYRLIRHRSLPAHAR